MTLTNEQLASIGGESCFEFEAWVGCGQKAIIVQMTYEYDATGTYNETIHTVKTPCGYFSLIDYLEESTIDDLCILGCKLLTESKIEVF